MREDLRCEQIRELLEAYALGALEEEEQGVVERHLSACPECRAVAAELREAAHALPLALAAASPVRLPSSLKGRVLQAVAGDGGTASKTGARRFWRPRVAIALATLAVVGGFSAWNAHLSSALSQERSMRERLAQLVGRQETVLDIVDSPRARRAVLRPPAGADSRAYGKVFTTPDLRDVVAMAARLDEPPAGETYRLWLTEAGRTRSPGRFAVNAQGFALLVFKAERPGPAFDEARVVLQRNDANKPAGTTVLVWRSAG
jgi:hypothetical protein